MSSYRKMYDAYKRIFDRCGLKNFPVEADTGVADGTREAVLDAHLAICIAKAKL